MLIWYQSAGPVGAIAKQETVEVGKFAELSDS